MGLIKSWSMSAICLCELSIIFGDGRRWGVEMGYSFEGHIEEKEIVSQPIGSAGGVKKIQQFSRFFDDTFLVICGDALIDLDITAAVRKTLEIRS